MLTKDYKNRAFKRKVKYVQACLICTDLYRFRFVLNFMTVCGLVLSLLYTLLIHENNLTHLYLSLVYKASDVVY